MVFALDNDDGGLHAFPSPVEAAAHCKGVDVDDGYWRFFADDGSLSPGNVLVPYTWGPMSPFMRSAVIAGMSRVVDREA